MTKTPEAEADALRGISRLLVDAVVGLADVVEDMHSTIANGAPVIGSRPAARTAGITGLVYRSVRGVAGTVGVALDAALSRLTPLLGEASPSPRREAMRAALNGVLGDYLCATNNPLAIPMQWRVQGQPFKPDPTLTSIAGRAPCGRILILLHGLCMNDLQWRRGGHDHGQVLAESLGYTPLYLHYNSGMPIHENGARFSALIEELVRQWPVPVTELVLLGHSMGGLLARSACIQARTLGHRWPDLETAMICLGSPHHGAPLERAGTRVDWLIGSSPYTAPLARLGQRRSVGIRDLGHGQLLPADTQSDVPGLPHSGRCLLIAASKQAGPDPVRKHQASDGLVPVASALGQGRHGQQRLPVADADRRICYGLNHFDLLGSRVVFDHLHAWLQSAAPG